MNGRVTLKLRDWGDGTAELSAEVKADGFSGRGAASFNRRDLREHARAFAIAPKQGERIEIAGGYWSKNEPNVLEQELLYIGVFPVDSRGNLGIRIRLATPYDDSTRSGVQSAVSVELTIGHSQLIKFAEEFLALVGGNLEDVVVEAIGQ